MVQVAVHQDTQPFSLLFKNKKLGFVHHFYEKEINTKLKVSSIWWDVTKKDF
jgi:hypothetical protein